MDPGVLRVFCGGEGGEVEDLVPEFCGKMRGGHFLGRVLFFGGILWGWGMFEGAERMG